MHTEEAESKLHAMPFNRRGFHAMYKGHHHPYKHTTEYLPPTEIAEAGYTVILTGCNHYCFTSRSHTLPHINS